MEWYKDLSPKEGDVGWSVYYKKRGARGKKKGSLTSWISSGSTYSTKDEAIAKAGTWPFKNIMVRKVRFVNHRTWPLKDKIDISTTEV